MIARTTKALGLASAVLVAATIAVFAQSAPSAEPSQGRNPGPLAACRSDLQTLCGSIPAGNGARLQCLVENRAKASAPCQSALAAIQDNAVGRTSQKAAKGEKRARFAACQGDIATLCPEAAKGGGRAQCLAQNQAKLSPACSTALQAIKQTRVQSTKQARESCRADAQALCGNTENGRGSVMRCLRDNEAKVSPACGQALAALPLRKRDRGAQVPAASPGTVPAAPAAPTVPAAPAKPQ